MADLPNASGLPSYSRLSVQLGELVISQAASLLAPLKLSPREYDALRCIRHGEGLSQQELGKQIGMFSSRVVALIDELEGRKLVNRVVSSVDRRRYVLSLTDQGQELLSRADVLAAEFDHDLFGDVSAEELERMTILIDRLVSLPCAGDATSEPKLSSGASNSDLVRGSQRGNHEKPKALARSGFSTGYRPASLR